MALLIESWSNTCFNAVIEFSHSLLLVFMRWFGDANSTVLMPTIWRIIIFLFFSFPFLSRQFFCTPFLSIHWTLARIIDWSLWAFHSHYLAQWFSSMSWSNWTLFSHRWTCSMRGFLSSSITGWYAKIVWYCAFLTSLFRKCTCFTFIVVGFGRLLVGVISVTSAQIIKCCCCYCCWLGLSHFVTS